MDTRLSPLSSSIQDLRFHIKSMSASLAPECNEIKEKYDTCFLKWYSEKYLRGSSSEDECKDLFTKYSKCLNKALKEKGIDKMLAEARESTSETDAEHLRR